MPGEPMREWWPLAVLAVGIVTVGAVWFTRWVTGRLERDRTRGHEHAGMLQLHEYRLDEHGERLGKVERDVHDLKERGRG